MKVMPSNLHLYKFLLPDWVTKVLLAKVTGNDLIFNIAMRWAASFHRAFGNMKNINKCECPWT